MASQNVQMRVSEVEPSQTMLQACAMTVHMGQHGLLLVRA